MIIQPLTSVDKPFIQEIPGEKVTPNTGNLVIYLTSTTIGTLDNAQSTSLTVTQVVFLTNMLQIEFLLRRNNIDI